MTDRTTGLKDLVRILKHNRGKPSLEALGNKAYLALCETLFQCMRDERSAYLRSKARTPKTSALLPLSANALRAVVHTGVRTIKSSTVESIIDTIIEVLPGKDGAFVKPLLEDLPKALRALLDYQPHVERLSRDCWDAAVDFCIGSLELFLVEPATEEPNSWSTGVSSRAQTPFNSTDLTAKSSSRTQSVKKQLPEDVVYAADDFVHCLQLLCKASNAPLLEKAERILAALTHFLKRKTGRGSGAALAAINCVLSRVALHSIQVTTHAIEDFLPLMKFMWSETGLREEILITLLLTEAHISNLLTDRNADATSLDLENLVDTMYSDYRRRQETTVLQFLEDEYLCFRHVGSPGSNTHPLSTYAFSLETEHLRCEPLWATVSAIAHWSSRLDERKELVSNGREDHDQMRPKRIRTVQHFQEYLRHVSETRTNAKRAAIQVIAFMINEMPLNEDDLQSAIDKLTPYITDENPVHSSWAMIALTG